MFGTLVASIILARLFHFGAYVSPGTLRHCLLASVSSNDADCLENLQS